MLYIMPEFGSLKLLLLLNNKWIQSVRCFKIIFLIIYYLVIFFFLQKFPEIHS